MNTLIYGSNFLLKNVCLTSSKKKKTLILKILYSPQFIMTTIAFKLVRWLTISRTSVEFACRFYTTQPDEFQNIIFILIYLRFTFKYAVDYL